MSDEDDGPGMAPQAPEPPGPHDIHRFVRGAGYQTADWRVAFTAHVRAGYKIDVIDPSGKTPLMLAIENRCYYSVLMILELIRLTPAARINMSGSRVVTDLTVSSTVPVIALHMALYHRREPLVIRRLVDAGADVEWLDRNRRNALLVAAETGACVDCVRAILSQSQGIDRTDIYGNTALHVVCSGLWSPPRLDVVELLLNEGADVTLANNDGKTPVDLALAYNPRIGVLFAKRGVPVAGVVLPVTGQGTGSGLPRPQM